MTRDSAPGHQRSNGLSAGRLWRRLRSVGAGVLARWPVAEGISPIPTSPIPTSPIPTGVLDSINDYEHMSRNLASCFTSEQELIWFLARMLVPIARIGFATHERKQKLFHIAESFGVHLLPAHFCSPLPVARDLPDRFFSSQIPMELDDALQLSFLEELSAYSAELKSVPEESSDGVFGWKNPSFCKGDAILYYCILRHLQPRRVVEVGSGYTALIAKMAKSRGGSFHLSAIEPFPYAWLAAAVDELIVKPVQEVALEYFTSLKEGDVLFVDSTHVSKAGSDVNYLFLHVLPRLSPGVVVHIHDIFLPWEYDRKWLNDLQIFWNEGYLLAAFLSGNKNWEVLAGNQYLGRKFPAECLRAFPDTGVPGGGSFWMRRIA